jgi:hypothetical protein
MSEGLLLQALREKKSLATSIKASGAHDWDVSQVRIEHTDCSIAGALMKCVLDCKKLP